MTRDLSAIPALLEQARTKLDEAQAAFGRRDLDTTAKALQHLADHARWIRYVLEANR